MAMVQNDEEILPKVSNHRVGRTNVTDDRRQTTDGFAIANTRSHIRVIKRTLINNNSTHTGKWSRQAHRTICL